MIYADNAATTKLDRDAFEAMLPWLQDEYGNASQPYSFARKPKKVLAEARSMIAECVGAFPEEIYFTSGGTESNNWAIKGTTVYGDCKEIITSSVEHHAILHACAACEKLGYSVKYLPVNRNGIISEEDLAAALLHGEKQLVSCMMANNEIGTIEPVGALCKMAHEHGAMFHTDAVQAIGHVPVDVHTIGVDLLSSSAHKFNGPKGIGFMYIRKGTRLAPYADGGAQEFGLRAGTENVASIVGMAVALKKNCAAMQQNVSRLYKIENVFLQTLEKCGVDYIRNGGKNHIPGNVNVSIKAAKGEMLLHRLDLMGICISTGSACDSVNTQISHVIKEIHVPKEYANGTIRVSFGRDNTEKEAVLVAQSIAQICCRSKS